MAARIVDLSIAIHEGHCRWAVDRVLARSFEAGDTHQATQMTFSFHAFTHMDSPRHFDREGFTTSAITPEMTVGPGVVVDLSATPPNTPITAAEMTSMFSETKRIVFESAFAAPVAWLKLPTASTTRFP
ncbi:MAG: cyclase family protein, partial [Rhodospirillaceae bacterium]